MIYVLVVFKIATCSSDCGSDGSSDDNNGAIIALAALFVIAVIGLIISVVIIIYVVMKLKQSRCDITSIATLYVVIVDYLL